MNPILKAFAAYALLRSVGFASGQEACTFTISSSGGISCPAGQLSDGQIRLNGSEPTAEFSIAGGQITDSAGRGCIVTGMVFRPAGERPMLIQNVDPPTTQIQCDQGAAPASGFAIGADGTLSYQGSSQFYACPATDTEYNIYVDPNFGQSKCFPVTLTASGCGSCPSQGTSTAWQTTTATETVWQTVTVVLTQTSPCTTTSVAETTRCHKCESMTGSWNSSTWSG